MSIYFDFKEKFENVKRIHNNNLILILIRVWCISIYLNTVKQVVKTWNRRRRALAVC